eukprot:Blabericola_migrator_1__59@NODE_1014_length_5701_cov_211_092474_g696_i0_p3_GENE_NODE_1014_length_5701_cov_211_092474_g696_i0NODE_1014_length_5701_cov_211_092474_g696_i0_p3_ORF_typecomplete_len346_score67_39Prenyltrans/PF00432_21/61Prenyltrans/PF00432_21/1_4e08Prenyltrans/PF00432_21/1_3e06Prenyltrans/PF00432_21/1_2e09Prenyltrans/PF00432_21/1_9e05Prenyltrans/PF00432_21/2_1e05SQHop_cyclase_C/PF13243_6/0_36SQHop_cyclase_C/PF13243_6/2_9e08SQHop_cyclase_C/PF13243_6/89SQHop_cyclase_N/PF13249_6/0_0081SQ
MVVKEQQLKQFVLTCLATESGAPSFAVESVRVHIIYWCLLALSLFHDNPVDLKNCVNTELSAQCTAQWWVSHEGTPSERLIQFLLDCQNADTGFGPSPNIFSQLTATMYALSALTLLGFSRLIDVSDFVLRCQNEDGSFNGEGFGDVDARYSDCAAICLHLCGRSMLSDSVPKAVKWLVRCQNVDGGFGSSPTCESHAAYCFVAYHALRHFGALHQIRNPVGLWTFLLSRFTVDGFVNGRPEKRPDLCYSWWALGVLIPMCDASDVDLANHIDVSALRKFIETCQDESGGLRDSPVSPRADIFHTAFGLMGYLLLNELLVSPEPSITKMTAVHNLLHLKTLASNS